LLGKEVRVRKIGNSVLLEPIEQKFDVKAWRRRLDEAGAEDFLPEGRPEQPPLPDDDDVSCD
jgi:antitoxin VapB